MLTPMKAVRVKCLDCSCGSFTEVEHCPVECCPLYPYRFGKNPNRTGIGNRSAKPPVANSVPTQHGTKTANSPTEGKDTSETNYQKINGESEDT